MKHNVSLGSRRGFLLSILAATALGVGAVQAQTQPPNSLSITSYGASTSASDNTAAIQSCLNAAQAQGVGVWIPAGTWQIQGSLTATDVTITGAGMNTSTIYRQQNSSSVVATQIETLRCTIRDLGIDGNGTARGVNASYGINMKGVGWLVERVRVSHSDAAMWLSGSNGTVQNCVIVTAYADAINLNNSNGPNGIGAYLTAQNNTINGTGDDSIAINSQGISLGRQNMQDPKVLNNTVTGTFGANGLRIAGGVNSLVSGNLVSDTTSNAENGIQVGKFGGDGFQLVNGSVTNNTFTRVGGHADTAGIWVYEDAQCTFSGNNILDANHHGVRIGSCNITFGSNNTIDNPNLKGIWITATSGGTGGGTTTGSANIIDNTVSNLNAGQPAFQNDAGGSMSVTVTGNSWQGGGAGKKLVPGTTVSLRANANNLYVTAGASPLVANSGTVGAAQTFQVVDAGGGKIALRALVNDMFVCAENAGTQSLIANRGSAGLWETFTEVSAGGNNVGLIAEANGEYVCAENGGAAALIANRPALGLWETFTVTVVGGGGSGGATFFADYNYSGGVSQLIPVGNYTLTQLAARGLPNDWASSLQLTSGRTVIMYSDDNFSGQSWTRTANTPNFGSLSPNANDMVSSVRVQ